MNNRIHKKKRY